MSAPSKQTRNTSCVGLVLALVLSSGCGIETPAPEATDATRRMVSLAPNITDIIIELGLADELVGISTYCRAPGHAVTRVGGYLDPDVETIVSLAPDLVVTPPNPRLEEAMEPFRRKVYVVSSQWSTVENTQAAIMEVAELLDAADRGAELVDTMRQEIEGLSRETEGKPKKGVLLVIARQPGGIIVAGADTFLTELMATAGGENVVREGRRYPMLSIESVVQLAPEVILDFSIREDDWSAAAEQQAREVWSVYPSLPAVQSGGIKVEPPGALMQPGPHMGRSARRLHELIHGA